MTTRLWLLRHGPVECAEGLCYGASDVHASAQASRDIADRVARQLPKGLEFYASPLSRCAQLAFALEALRPDLQAQFDTRIAEMDFGAWEGQAWAAWAMPTTAGAPAGAMPPGSRMPA